VFATEQASLSRRANQLVASGVAGADLYVAATGSHTIRIQPREDGLSLDQIVLSSSRYRTLAPGANKHDRTILPKEPIEP
jgi:hypothetical protein